MRGSEASNSKESFMNNSNGRKESGGSISNEPSKPHSLKDFYLKVLDKRNQQFLFELTKQTHTMAGQKDPTAEQDLTKMITLAIKTLANYDFAQFSMCIVYFIEQTVIYFLDDDNPQVRKEAM